jgi:hypothetical protein
MNVRRSVWPAILAGFLVGVQTGPAAGQTGQAPARRDSPWGFGTDVGFENGTADGTVFVLRFNANLYLSPAFSLGPSLMVTPVQDYNELSISGLARFHIEVDRGVEVVPFSGIGFVDAEFPFDDPDSEETIEAKDRSLYFPLGMSVNWAVGEDIFAVGTILANLHSLDYGAPVGKDEGSVGLLIGVQYKPGGTADAR